MYKKILIIGVIVVLAFLVVGTQFVQKKGPEEISSPGFQETPPQYQEQTSENKLPISQTPQPPQAPQTPQTAESTETTETTETKTPEIEYQRQDITFLKFVSSENCLYSLDDGEIEELRSLNINGIRICPLYSVRDGSLKEDVPESRIIYLIRRAHQAGFAVFLEPNALGPGFSTLDDRYIDEVHNIAMHWAKIAEKEKVEFYSPLNEPDATFSNSDLVNQWIEMSQDLKSEFSGNLVLKFASIGPERIGSVGGYDYLAFDIMWGDSQYQELREFMKMAVKRGNSLKEKYHMKGFFFGELGAERSRVDRDVQAEIFKIFLEETWGKVDGYCFLGWSDLEFKFRDNEKAIEIIKEWYSRPI